MNADLQPLQPFTNETVRIAAKRLNPDTQPVIDEIKEESQEQDKDAFDEDAEDTMLRAELRKMIRFDGDFLQGFTDLVTDGKVNLAVDK